MATDQSMLNRKRLFFAANLSLFMVGLGFAVRANIASALQHEMFDKLDLANSVARLLRPGVSVTATIRTDAGRPEAVRPTNGR